ncbi:undecaprenyl-diphosphate phosphatase [sulfur-oxidizing endosymbiont of Gigantopelta aegis]|uniref:undecaprenyl-diphosphate phosphatase n=1 Tax=sulfur-oxidizing endosymbiont of Gigantopelta aegis TaxID=2794934 RepID=UPI0018DBD2FB|nr:undecaprenyl-diphosphate phosphatase [sulfur-oxidizing endosymbiont of Gigantopelta aegis]
MDLIQIVILALVQGLSEFLPISSSAHLILVPQIFGWADQGLAFDVATHIGSLSAVLWYFRNDIKPLFMDWLKSIQYKRTVGDSVLAWGVILGTIPAAIAGLLINDYSEHLRNPTLIASTTIIFGLLLWYADSRAQKQLALNIKPKTEHQLNLKIILFIGFAQAIALIPGTSRSGITITAALLMGMSRTASARFSFLLSIPLIIAAGLFKSIELSQTATHIPWSDIFIGTFLSAISAYLCIHYFIKMLDSIGMMPFIIYRMFLGIFLFWMFT